MSHSYRRLLVHLVFATKSREPYLKPTFENDVYEYISDALKELVCKPYIINGTENHVHVLFELSNSKSVAQVAKHIKGKSSFLISERHSTEFAWQNGYSVFSVGQSEIDRVYNYIKNQKEHHKTIAFDDELKSL